MVVQYARRLCLHLLRQNPRQIHRRSVQREESSHVFNGERETMKSFTKITNKKGLVFWRDNKTNLLWSPPLKDKYTFDQAIEITQASFVAELGKFKDRAWGIPTRDEITVAISNGLLEVLPNAESFWSASVFSYNRRFAWVFYGTDGFVNYYPRSSGFGVRCCGRPS